MKRRQLQDGFSAVEFIVASVVFGILVVGIINTVVSVRHTYEVARELNEMYIVLSACPEIDRALEFNSLTSATNCSPSNAFSREDSMGGQRTYTPTLTVTSTTDPAFVSSNDPLKNIPDSKVVDVQVGFQKQQGASLELRMLVTRNGVGQQ